MHRAKNITFFLVLVVLALSVLQLHYSIFRESLLKGYALPAKPPDLKYFTWGRWFSRDFQQVTTTRVNDNTGFRTTLIRINNQYDFSCFGITHAPEFLEGKDHYLFEEGYIHEYTGKYFVGTRIIDKTLARLKDVSDSLASYNIPLILVYESGKPSIYPEFIPDRFHHGQRTMSNYDYFVSRSAKIGLPFLDITRYLLRVKDTARYPLFPRYGMHWSMYGVHLVADTLSRFIAKASGKTMPVFKVHHMHHSGNSLGSDYDVGDMFNLICPLKPTPEVYPMVSFRFIPEGTSSALVIADSYYNTLVETYGRKMFGKQDFWYYNSSVYPHQNEIPPVRADKTDLKQKLKKYDVILLMVSDINLHCCFWNFADEAFLAFHPEIKSSQLDKIENSVRIDREWFRFMVKKAQEQGRSLEDMIHGDAMYAFYSNYNNLPDKTYWDTIYHIAYDIKNNPQWFAVIEKKARERKISTDSMMIRDAIYTYGQWKIKH
jgi:hypothetical protein